ncbi:hypothetical protein MLD38_006865 [Melastoma candidum]|uniref:Uncharacterized protein n=1 Tax=Melastoma candidum TaxID=119954 RepID=A0ACB9RTG2_9MYRT|nr:hypothetical protein MLD38_006865 [Melastoma candidum]
MYSQLVFFRSKSAGCYAAEKMLKRYETARVDVIDRLATPFGFVQQDHPETKVRSSLECDLWEQNASIYLWEWLYVLSSGGESYRSLGIQGQDGVQKSTWLQIYSGRKDSRLTVEQSKHGCV